MTFEITERDKKLLYFLVVFAIVIGLGFGVLRPLLEKNQEVSQQLADARIEKMDKETKIAKIPLLEQSVASLEEELADIQSSFYEETSSMEIDRTLTGMALACGLGVKDLDIDMPQPGGYVSLVGYRAMLDSYDSEQKASGIDFPGAYAAKITMILNGSRSSLQSMMDSCASLEPKLRVTELSWQKGKTEDSYTLSLSMEFYMYENVTEYMAGQAAAAEAAAAEAEKQPDDSLTEE